MKELYIVRDVPRYEEEFPNYCYVVRAESHAEAIDIVRKKTKCQWDLEAELADNKEVWEQIIGEVKVYNIGWWNGCGIAKRGIEPNIVEFGGK